MIFVFLLFSFLFFLIFLLTISLIVLGIMVLLGGRTIICVLLLSVASLLSAVSIFVGLMNVVCSFSSVKNEIMYVVKKFKRFLMYFSSLSRYSLLHIMGTLR